VDLVCVLLWLATVFCAVVNALVGVSLAQWGLTVGVVILLYGIAMQRRLISRHRAVVAEDQRILADNEQMMARELRTIREHTAAYERDLVRFRRVSWFFPMDRAAIEWAEQHGFPTRRD
jgi:type VI protein secretion system component VasK